jgi:rhamnose utilization protein RhaD (predicted bifunctional aldolase and dehydrogenase)
MQAIARIRIAPVDETLVKGDIPNRWNDSDAPGDAVEQLIYRSRLLGSDLRVTNFAGGNTSCKRPSQDCG